MRPQPPQREESQPPRAYLAVALLVTGASSLVLEIVGARLISPYYGSSIYCWSALITVTLVALAGGYNLGGRWADREASLTLFASLVCWAALACATIPALRAPALAATTGLGIQLGALASATILVAPTLTLLGALGPIVVKLETSSVGHVGRTSGDVFAVSTIGSVLGAMLTGFALVPHFRLSRILWGVSAVLLALGCVGLHLARVKRRTFAIAGAAAVAAACLAVCPRPEASTNLLLARETAYGQLKILDFNGRRYLLLDGTAQTMALLPSLAADLERSPHLRALELAAGLRPGLKRALVVGVGGGLLLRDLERGGAVVDGVELDPDVLAAARRYFALAPRGRIAVEDGRTFLERSSPGGYGAVFFDAFAPEAPPAHLFTEEGFGAAKRSLAAGGVLGVNLVSVVEGADRPWLHVFRTLQAVFPNVRAFVAGDAYSGLANVVFLASDGPLPVERLAPPPLRELKPTTTELASVEPLTDDRSPIESLLAETSARWRRGLQEQIPSVLLY